MESLISLSTKLTTINEEAFVRDYGKMIGLLTIKVNVGALVSLVR